VKKIISTASLFLFAVGSLSFAASKESGSVSFPSTVRVGTTTLPAGTYSVHWDAGSNDVQLQLSGKGHDVSVPATAAPAVTRDEVLIHRAGTTDVVDGFTVKTTSFTIKNQ
jgi:hypothetical protein